MTTIIEWYLIWYILILISEIAIREEKYNKVENIKSSCVTVRKAILLFLGILILNLILSFFLFGIETLLIPLVFLITSFYRKKKISKINELDEMNSNYFEQRRCIEFEKN